LDNDRELCGYDDIALIQKSFFTKAPADTTPRGGAKRKIEKVR
jgi:hypothetical protein